MGVSLNRGCCAHTEDIILTFKVIQIFWHQSKLVGDFLLSSIVTLVVSCRVSEILGPRAHVFDTPHLFRTKFHCVPAGIDPWCWGGGSSESEHRRLTNRDIIPVILFSKNSNLCDCTSHQPYRRTDRRRTDRRHTIANWQYRALRSIAR